MVERKQLWLLHNRLAGEWFMVVMEEDTFINDILLLLCCEHPLATRMERQMSQVIAVYETFDYNKVVPDFFLCARFKTTAFRRSVLSLNRNRGG
jgi:hypothetical protein